MSKVYLFLRFTNVYKNSVILKKLQVLKHILQLLSAFLNNYKTKIQSLVTFSISKIE